MTRGWGRALAFARGWKAGPAALEEREIEVVRRDRTVPATLLRPTRRNGPLAAWVVLHGITRPGRGHPSLQRFVRALASSGAAVLVPEIPEWRELHIAPEQALDTLRASVHALLDVAPPNSGRLGVMGFSFGVRQVLLAGADPHLAPHLGCVAGFGGYASLARTARFLFLGEHEWKGRWHRADPDPYGRWVLGGNYLPQVPGYEDAEDVAHALLELGRRAGEVQVGSWEPALDPVKDALQESLPPERRELFRVFAPRAGELPPREPAQALASALATAALESSPFAEPASFLSDIRVPVRLMHGRSDRLIPYTETLRLRDAFPPTADMRATVTGLFSHSYRHRGGRWGPSSLGEPLRFLRMLADLLSLV